jgi:hypothetical protein
MSQQPGGFHHASSHLEILVLLLIGAVLSSPEVLAALSRSAAEVRIFRAEHPCPVTGRRSGACPDWQVDHAVPLCAGGEDKASNMHWLSLEDHRFKTLVDMRECRKLRRLAATPAR